MSEQDQSPTVPVVPVQTPPEPEKPRVMANDLPEAALTARLEQARRAAVSELLSKSGFANQEQFDKAAAEFRASEEAKKSDAERHEALRVEFERTQTRLTNATRANELAWNQVSATLTPEQVQAVESIAGEDLATRLSTLYALAPTWGKAAPQPPTPPATPPAAQVPPNTGPLPSAPAPTSGGAPTDHWAVHKTLSASSPRQAAQYLAKHAREMYPNK